MHNLRERRASIPSGVTARGLPTSPRHNCDGDPWAYWAPIGRHSSKVPEDISFHVALRLVAALPRKYPLQESQYAFQICSSAAFLRNEGTTAIIARSTYLLTYCLDTQGTVSSSLNRQSAPQPPIAPIVSNRRYQFTPLTRPSIAIGAHHEDWLYSLSRPKRM